MKSPIKINTPLAEDVISTLKAGDQVLLNGIVYTARDAAHKRMVEALQQGNDLPVQLDGQILFYAGPAPAPADKVMGAIGPTTSSRMDSYTPELLSKGLKGMIGKGRRSSQVRNALLEYKAVYFGAIGGAAALLSQYVLSASVVAYSDLGPEAIYRLELKDFPVLVLNDCHGNDWYGSVVKHVEMEDGGIAHSIGFRDFLHNIRSPVSTLTEWLNAFLQGHVDADYFQDPERLGNIRNRAQSVLEMIDQYLLFEQAQVRNKESVTFELLPLIQSVINFYSLHAKEKHVQLDLDTKEKHVCIQANQLDIEILFSILIDNAIKYNVKGGQVTISIEVFDLWIEVQINDTGLGIDEKDIPFIFEEFYRADIARLNNIKGAGLGLANANKIVHALRGELEVASTIGVGTDVVVKFPKSECL